MGGDDLLGEGVCVRAGGDPEGPEGGGRGCEVVLWGWGVL